MGTKVQEARMTEEKTEVELTKKGPAEEEEMSLHRTVLTQKQLIATYADGSVPKRKSAGSRLVDSLRCTKHCLANVLHKHLPIIDVLASYDVKTMLLPDILAGLSLAILHIPMGMGFGLLASLSPVYGLYTSFFPLVLYAIFGTSPHTSFGSNAVIAVVVAAIVDKQTENMSFNATMSDSVESLMNISSLGLHTSSQVQFSDEFMEYKVSVAAATSVVVGAFLALLGIFKLGILAVFFSDPLISGFTFGASIQIGLFQFTKMLGLNMKSRAGVFKFILTLKDLFDNIGSSNVAAITMSLGCVFMLVLVKEWFNVRFKSKLYMPIPMDFIVAALATTISHFADLSVRYDLPIVNEVPTGIAKPMMPAFHTIPNIIADSLVIAVLIFALSMSVAKLIAKQWQYSIDENQELIAYGMSNIISGFFQCFPSCQAPPRAMMAASLKAKTTIMGLVSAIVVLFVLLFIGQYLKALPISALAAMIVVSLSRLYCNIFDTKRFWRMNKCDFIIWMATASVTIFIDMDIGIYAGLGTSLLVVIVQLRQSSGVLLGQAEDGDLFLELNNSFKVKEIPGVKIFRFKSPLFFGNAELFQQQLYNLTVQPDVINHHPEVMVSRESQTSEDINDDSKVEWATDSLEKEKLNSRDENIDNQKVIVEHSASCLRSSDRTVNSIILDFSRITYIDSTAIKMLELVSKSYDIVDIPLIFAECSMDVYGSLHKVEYFSSLPDTRFTLDVFAALTIVQDSVCEQNETFKV